MGHVCNGFGCSNGQLLTWLPYPRDRNEPAHIRPDDRHDPTKLRTNCGFAGAAGSVRLT